jgi:dihydrofolate reductase
MKSDNNVTWRNTIMSKLVVRAFTISLDGYGAGPEQSLENPLGKGGEALHEWFIPTPTFRAMTGKEGGETGIDEDFAAGSFENLGAWILGRNMFGPVRGPWPDDSWKGWWGDTPPYHVPVFVLTHHARPSIEMKGGTTFHFVTDGIDSALRQAREAAGGKDVRVGGGVATVHQYLRKRLIDDMHIAVSPLLLGSGESLFAGIDLAALGYACTEQVGSPRATHFTVTKQG